MFKVRSHPRAARKGVGVKLESWSQKLPLRRLALLTSAAATLLILGPGRAAADESIDEVQPSPPSIGADVPVTYFGPPPTEIEPELIGPRQLLTAGKLDLDAGTITMPLYEGQLRDTGEKVWFIVTDTSDEDNARALGLNYSAKLAYADTCRAARNGVIELDGTVTIDHGAVDFAPERVIVPGAAPNLFPPTVAEPGAVGDEFYSPLLRIENAGGEIYNAPIVAFGSDLDQLNYCDSDPDPALVHDKVVRICPAERTVTLKLIPGFSFAKPVLYLTLDANDPLPAALEGVTLAPALRDVSVGRDDTLFSPVERLFAIVNGPMGTDNPQRQGFNSALAGERGPLNVLGGIPTVATDYSPLWDVNAGEWTADAIAKGYRARVTEEFQILGMVQRGFMTGPGGAPFGSTGFIVNCPIVHRFL